MKTFTEFCDWLEIHGCHAEIVVCQEDYLWLWDRIREPPIIRGAALLVQGRRIRPALKQDILDVSDWRLFE